jgi:proline iminopeptidase
MNHDNRSPSIGRSTMPVLSVAATSAMLVLSACAQQQVSPAAPERGTVTANGIAFDYAIEGDGPVCMVVGDATPVERAISDRLRERLRLVYLGSRMSTPEDRVGDVTAVTMDTLIHDIEVMRHALELGRVCVIGHSISGLLALEYARKYPENVTGVVMHATPPFYNDRLGAAVSAFWDTDASAERKALRQQDRAAMPEDSLRKLPPGEAMKLRYVTSAPVYFHDPAYDPAWILEGVTWNVPAWDQLFGSIMPGYDPAARPPARVPVFLALGRSDFAVPHHVWDEAERSRIPDLTFRLFDRSGHYPMLEEHELFDTTLIDWMESRLQ